MKPRLWYMDGRWFCGDSNKHFFCLESGDTPVEAYGAWDEATDRRLDKHFEHLEKFDRLLTRRPS